jgi:hypothetical protein
MNKALLVFLLSVVSVSAQADKPVSFTLTPSSLQLVVGESAAIVSSSPVKSWSVNAPSITALSGAGLVTAIAPGQAVITAKSGPYVAQAFVTVVAPEPPPPPDPVPPAVPLAFPGAQGFGATTRHAYAGAVSPVVLRVTNLNDSGTGSLRAALMDTRPRVIVFEVSGYIPLNSIINVVSPYFFVAGATAPSPGISVRNYAIQARTHDFVIQHIRNRVGTVSQDGPDGFAFYTDTRDGVFDHLSVAWAVDGSIDVSSGPTDDRRLTVSNCIMAEQLRNAGTTGTPPNNSRAMAIQNRSKHIAVLRNLFAHIGQRLPFMKADTATIVVNNLIYDQFQGIGMYFDDPDALNLPISASIVGNRWKQGPSAGLLGVSSLQGITVRSGIDAGSRLYRSDNTFVGAAYATFPYRAEVFDPTVTAPPSEAPITGIAILDSLAVEAHVLANAGARPLDRDWVDSRVVSQVTTGTGNYIDSPSEVGGYPGLDQNTRALTIPVDPHGVTGSGYTNLEVWLHLYAAGVEP